MGYCDKHFKQGVYYILETVNLRITRTYCTKLYINYVISFVSIGNSMISSDIWHKYHELCFKILLYVISRAVRRV